MSNIYSYLCVFIFYTYIICICTLAGTIYIIIIEVYILRRCELRIPVLLDFFYVFCFLFRCYYYLVGVLRQAEFSPHQIKNPVKYSPFFFFYYFFFHLNYKVHKIPVLRPLKRSRNVVGDPWPFQRLLTGAQPASPGMRRRSLFVTKWYCISCWV